jgi:Zn-dependent peptidase ImmA (M78 family)
MQVLDWAVSVSGYSDEGLASEAKLSSQRLRDIRTGTALPQTSELRNLAKALDRPIAFFFLPTPPKQAEALVSFRPPAGRNEARLLTNEERSAMRNAVRWQKITDWIVTRSGGELAPVVLPTLPKERTPQIAADYLADWLNWSLQDQFSATSANQVLRTLRGRLEERGVLVLQYSMGRDSCRGFSLPHPTVPLIAINSYYNAAARVYSLIHECAHLLRGDRAVCGNPRNDTLERWCERASALMLMPSSNFITYLNETFDARKVSNVVEVKKIANKYQVSLLAAAVRLIEVNRADPGLYGAVQQISEANPRYGGSSSEPQTTPVIRIRTLGTQIPRILLSARESGLLSDTVVRKYLDVNGPQLQEISNRILRMAVEV